MTEWPLRMFIFLFYFLVILGCDLSFFCSRQVLK